MALGLEAVRSVMMREFSEKLWRASLYADRSFHVYENAHKYTVVITSAFDEAFPNVSCDLKDFATALRASKTNRLKVTPTGFVEY